MEEKFVKSYIGRNADEMYEKMNKKGSFNVFCMLFGIIYMIYRKMYLVAFGTFLINTLLLSDILGNIKGGTLILGIILGFLFYPLYKWHITRKIDKFKQQTSDEDEINNMCIKKGGISIPALVITLVLLFISIAIIAFGILIVNVAMESGMLTQ